MGGQRKHCWGRRAGRRLKEEEAATEVGMGVLVRGCLSHQAQESGSISPKEPSHLPQIAPLWMEPE